MSFLGLSPIPPGTAGSLRQFPRAQSSQRHRRSPHGPRLGWHEARGASLHDGHPVPLATRGQGFRRRIIEASCAWPPTWARAHGRRFTTSPEKQWFKDKFQPTHGEPICNFEGNFSIWTLLSIAAAFRRSPPIVFLRSVMARR